MGDYLSLVAVLLFAGAAVAAAAAYLMARGLVRPPRMTDGKALYLLNRLTPKDLGLAFEPVTFRVGDEQTGRPLRLAAWWIPAAASPVPGGNAPPTGKTVVLVHGYADAKVGALAWVPPWRELGFDVLTIDLRAHGESDGAVCSAGFHERHDLAQVVNQLVAQKPAAGRTLVLFGASLGAAVAAAAAERLQVEADEGRGGGDAAGVPGSGGGPRPSSGHRPGDVPPPVAAVVLESPFADFRSAAAAHLDRLGLPGGWLRRAAIAWAARMAAADFAAVRPADLIGRLRCPVLVLAAGEDVYVSPAEAAEVERAVAARPPGAGPAAHRRFDHVEHLMAVVDAPDAYRAALRAFVEEVVGNGR